jgi:hypothetical protein
MRHGTHIADVLRRAARTIADPMDTAREERTYFGGVELGAFACIRRVCRLDGS